MVILKEQKTATIQVKKYFKVSIVTNNTLETIN